MPADFDRCVRRGGKIRTITPKEGTYIHVCYPSGGGSPVHGEVKQTQDKNKEEKK
jgi:hypothetical protein